MIWRQFGAAQVEISLRQRTRSLLFLIGVGAAGLLLAAETSLSGMASSFATPSQGRWLLALNSDDAQLQYRMAQVYKNIDSAESVRHLRRATELSPYNRFYWSRLGSACESMNDMQCADQAHEPGAALPNGGSHRQRRDTDTRTAWAGEQKGAT
jgi:predicted Zn-dependent protease